MIMIMITKRHTYDDDDADDDDSVVLGKVIIGYCVGVYVCKYKYVIYVMNVINVMYVCMPAM